MFTLTDVLKFMLVYLCVLGAAGVGTGSLKTRNWFAGTDRMSNRLFLIKLNHHRSRASQNKNMRLLTIETFYKISQEILGIYVNR